MIAMPKLVTLVTPLLVMPFLLPTAWADDYPAKPIRMIVGFPPGGGVDIVARIIGRSMGESFQRQVIIDNRPGANSVIGSELAAKAAPDGYTLLMISTSHAANAGFYKALKYDAVNDFAGVTQVASAPLLLVANPALPVKSIADLIALARSRSGQLNFASSGTGGTSHLAGELLKKMAGIELTHVPYQGVAPALTDVVSGQVQFMFPSVPAALPQVKAGRLRAVAVTSTKRGAALPDVPTVAESGFPTYEATNWWAMLAPARVPKQIITKLNATVLQTLRVPDVAEAIKTQGAEIVGSSPVAFQAYLGSEVAKWSKLIREVGIRPD